jgi:predicted RNA-binding protein with PUA-like domain
MPRHWLLKSEPDVFSFDDLWAAPRRTTHWDGVRNYQARNFLRDDCKKGDLAFFYHSSTDPAGIVGIVEVVKAGYPDHTAFERGHDHFDPKSDPANPTWIMVDVKAVERFPALVTLETLKATGGLDGMELLRRGSRLSVQPVSPAHWAIICALGRGDGNTPPRRRVQ